MGRVLGRLMLGVLVLGLVAFVGFQIWRSVYMDIQTQPAEIYQVTQSIQLTGIAVREEFVLEGAGENLSYLYADGERVSRYATVARPVSDRSAINKRMKRDVLQQELEALHSVSAAVDSVLLGGEAASTRVYADLDVMLLSAARGEFSGSESLRLSVQSQLNRRDLATGKVDGFEERIATLEQEIATLGLEPETDPIKEVPEEAAAGADTQIKDEEGADSPEKTPEENPENPESAGVPKSGTVVTSFGEITTAQPGFFTKTVDNLESVLTPQRVKEMSVAELAAIIETPVDQDGEQIGRIITSHQWRFVATLPSAEATVFTEGKKVELDFGLADQKPLIGKIESIRTDRGGDISAVTFLCDEMGIELCNLRVRKAEVGLSEVSGYKFPITSKRYERDTLGVYVLENTLVRFKPAEIVHENEEEGYIVYSDATKGGIRPYDSVIVEGRGLYDGKIVRIE